MTTDPRLAALLADPKRVAGWLREFHQLAIEGRVTMASDEGYQIEQTIAALALDRSAPEIPDDTIRVCRMCFTEPPHHAEGCDYTNLVRVK